MKKIFFVSILILVLMYGCNLQQNTGGTSSQQTAGSSPVTGATLSSTTPTQTTVTTQPSSVSTQPTTVPTQPVTIPTQPATIPTQPVTAPTQPETTPTQDLSEYVGTLYTRAQLEAMDSTHIGCPSGVNTPANTRPGQSIALNARYKKYDAHFIGPNEKTIYLTFTLGYEHNNLTASILDTLKEKNVKGIFIIDMYYARTYTDLVRRMIDEGHIVGNHSANHKDLSTLSIDRVVTEIMNVHNYVLENYNYEMTYFRPPSGYFSERVLAIAQSLGYTTLQYSFAYVDWEVNNQPDPTSSLQKMVNSLYNGNIYQFHTVSSTNAQVLGTFIDTAREKGFEFALYG